VLTSMATVRSMLESDDPMMEWAGRVFGQASTALEVAEAELMDMRGRWALGSEDAASYGCRARGQRGSREGAACIRWSVYLRYRTGA
jgi:hypothetical protein